MFPSDNKLHHLHEEEEEECRVCRGPAEEGRPLFKPCKCSGSIGLTHQDCLTSWLEVKAGSGKCDLCKHTFQFAPQYAPDAPATLSKLEVLLQLCLKLAHQWIPFAIRCIFVGSMWFGVMPLCTAYIYQGWMHRPSSVIRRMTWELVGSDLVNGCLLTVINVIGFLSIMSLAEFLRLQWNVLDTITTKKEEEDEDDEDNVLIQRDTIEEACDGEVQEMLERLKNPLERDRWFTRKRSRMEGRLRHGVEFKYKKQDPFASTSRKDRKGGIVRMKAQPNYRAADTKFPSNLISHEQEDYRASKLRLFEGENDNDVKAPPNYRAADTKYPSNLISHKQGDNHASDTKHLSKFGCFERDVEIVVDDYDDDDDDDDDEDYVDDSEDDTTDDESAIERMMQIQDEDDSDSDSNSDNSIQNNAPLEAREDIRAFNENLLNVQQMLADENLANEQMDAFDGEMAMEFGNLLGLRGPISHIFRNLAIILVFQTSFIFLFACVPCIVGSISFTIFSKNAVLSHVTKFLATKVLYLTFDLKTREGVPIDWNQTINIMNEENQRLQTLIQPRDVSLIVFGYLTYAMLSFSFNGCVHLYKTYFKANLSELGGYRNRVNPNDMNADEIKSFIAKTLTVASDCAAASSKISLLVCFKMFVLPLTLGIWLDLSTLQLFENSIEDRLTSAGADIIGAFLLHWVVGITFMLTVTVSILQLREVLHPDLLAPIIRPQEPQPDLLLQLLQESGFVHLKRMIPSVAIYASLLCIHIWLPCRLLRIFGVHAAIPLFRPKFWHLINPNLQSAVELLCFHLGVLSILEKQKNVIGLIQYNLLMKLSSCFGITKSLLPFATSKTFALVGEIKLRGNIDNDDTDPAIHTQNEEILLTLSELHKKRGVTDLYLESKLKLEEPTEGTIRAENIVTPDYYIIISPESSHNSRKVMPTRMGKYRFRKRVALKGRETIEIWKEEATEPIPRPPKGWDYLADDNAVDKGRWAWGKKEKKSEIEQNVASRDVFFPPVQKNGVLVPPYRSCQGLLKGLPMMLKLTSIVVISWIFITTISSIALFGPLIVGRFITHLLHIPDKYIHDPFLFCVGCTLIAPVVVSLTNNISMKNGIQTIRSRFAFPSLKKQLILFETLFLWLFASPLFIGVLYDSFFRNESLAALLQVKLAYMMNSWSTGFLLLHLCGAALFYGAFRREFWYTVRTLAVEGVAGGRGGGANRNNDRMAANRPRVDNNRFEFGYEHNRDQHTNQKDEWQGDDGRVGMFLHCIHSALWMYEWDKMDKDILLEKTLYPILQNTLTAIVIPMTIFLFTTISFDMGVIMYRASVIVVVLFEICSNLREPLKKWYISAHNTARDHRYLIGKILLNYEENHKLST